MIGSRYTIAQREAWERGEPNWQLADPIFAATVPARFTPRPTSYDNERGQNCTYQAVPGKGYDSLTDTAEEWQVGSCTDPQLGRSFALTGGVIQAIAATGGAATGAAARVYISGFNRSAAQAAAAARARGIARARALAVIKARLKMRARHMVPTVTRRVPFGR